MARPSVAVALCTYQGATHLPRQLQTIAAQTVAPDLLVLSDDGSTDRTPQLLEEFARTCASRVSVLRRASPLGVVGNFQHALRACDAEVVLLSDQDDVWRPDKVERLLDALAGTPDALLAFSDAELVDADERPLGRTQWQAVGLTGPVRRQLEVPRRATSALLRGSVVTGAATALRRELLACALPVPVPAYGGLHDAWLALVASCHGPLVPVADRLLQYRQHDEQHTGAPEPGGASRSVVLDADRQRTELLRERVETGLLLDRMRSCPHPAGPAAVAFLAEHLALVELRLAPDRRRTQVLGALARGAYGRHSGGARSGLKDLLGR